MTKEEIGQNCEPIDKNSDLANMGITTYYGGWTNQGDQTDANGVVWGYKAGTTFEEYTNADGVNGTDLVATPCGLIAKSKFTDTYKLVKNEDGGVETAITIDESGIAW